MEATLKYNLPEEQNEFESAINGWKWSIAIWEFDQHLRSQIKYNDKLSEGQCDTYQEIREKLWDVIRDKGLSFD